MDRYEAELLVLLEEVRQRSEEVRSRVNAQFLITAGNVAALSAVATQLRSEDHPSVTAVLLAIPVLNSLALALYLSQDVMILRAAGYCHSVLRPRVESVLVGLSPKAEPASVLGWETWLGRERRQSRLQDFLGAFGAVAVAAPGALILVGSGAAAVAGGIRFGLGEWMVVATELVVYVALGWVGVRLGYRYRAVDDPSEIPGSQDS